MGPPADLHNIDFVPIGRQHRPELAQRLGQQVTDGQVDFERSTAVPGTFSKTNSRAVVTTRAIGNEATDASKVPSGASHLSPKLTAKTERQVWRKSWASSAARRSSKQVLQFRKVLGWSLESAKRIPSSRLGMPR